jgi:hypothetical protein
MRLSATTRLLAIRSAFSLVMMCATGCVFPTVAKYEEKLNSWTHHDVNSLMQSWGPPSDTFVMPNGSKMYTWLNVGGTQVTSNYNQFLNMTTSNAVTYWCKTTFTVDTRGVIQTWRWEGNACRSK